MFDQHSTLGDAGEPDSKYTDLVKRLVRLEALLQDVVGQKPQKDWYTVAEVSVIVGKKPFTVREWCRLGRIAAKKRRCGRGDSQDWMISHAEVQRYLNEGLLPPDWRYRYGG